MNSTKKVNLALQGGGSHGAFTWGVLDALLEHGGLHFDGITGASAGAMNAVVMAHGWLEGTAAKRDPHEAAREALQKFWQAIAAQPSAFALGGIWSQALPRSAALNPTIVWLDLISRVWSPYQLNPFNYNPLRQVLKPLVDFERLRRTSPFKIFVAATNVRTGRLRIFREHELQVDAVLASACLPMTFQAVRVDGEDYWDGGYMGNPALWPLFYACRSTADLVLVPINPLRRDALPNTAQEIIERINEISFNSSLLQEMRAIDFVQRLLREDRVDPKRYQSVRLHVISGEEKLRDYQASSKYNTAPEFLRELFETGRAIARDWLESKLDYVGHAGSVSIASTYL